MFKSRERFEAIVKPSHYLRVVTEKSGGGTKDIVTAVYKAFGYEHPDYQYLPIIRLTMQTRTVSLVGATLSNTTTSTQPSSE